jgi:hypothetical protein
MLTKYQTNFAALSPAAEALVASALLRRHPKLPPYVPGGLFRVCEDAGLDQADVVCAVAGDSSPLAVQAMEILAGIPVTVGTPCLTKPKPVVSVAKPSTSAEAPARVREPQPARAPRQSVTDPRIITAVVPNPKRPGSASFDRFDLYVVGMTVNEAIAAGVKREDIAWDSDPSRKFITLESR